jgi:hypothetical protein
LKKIIPKIFRVIELLQDGIIRDERKIKHLGSGDYNPTVAMLDKIARGLGKKLVIHFE